ncbi:decarboxylase [Streptomyces sp. NPDC002588]|uniref:aspartate racemase/maleate isomerase family protein n=1 Tax=Streptomyces sp. NPDC002588 TaxID=3154419 RepID=UPI00332E1CE8
MTALGILHAGHSAEDDYPRIEQLLGSDIRLDLVLADPAEDPPELLGKAVEQLRLAGAEAIVWAGGEDGFVRGWDAVQQQVRGLATIAGMPASATVLAFVHAARELGVRRVAVATSHPEATEFLTAGGLEVVGGTREAGGDALTLARAADTPGAEAVLLPDSALHTVAHLPALERELGKPVLTAGQVTVWEALRLTNRRVNAPGLGALFTREPIVQA